MEKQISLKNNKTAFLRHETIDNAHFLNAYSTDGKKVGFCKFVINQTFVRPLSVEQRKIYADNHKIDFDSAPKFAEITRKNQKRWEERLCELSFLFSNVKCIDFIFWMSYNKYATFHFYYKGLYLLQLNIVFDWI